MLSIHAVAKRSIERGKEPSIFLNDSERCALSGVFECARCTCTIEACQVMNTTSNAYREQDW